MWKQPGTHTSTKHVIIIAARRKPHLYIAWSTTTATSWNANGNRYSNTAAVSILSQEIARNRPDIVICAASHVCGAVISKAESEGLFTIATLSSSLSIFDIQSAFED